MLVLPGFPIGDDNIFGTTRGLFFGLLGNYLGLLGEYMAPTWKILGTI